MEELLDLLVAGDMDRAETVLQLSIYFSSCSLLLQQTYKGLQTLPLRPTFALIENGSRNTVQNYNPDSLTKETPHSSKASTKITFLRSEQS